MKRLFSFAVKLIVVMALAVWLADRPGTAHIVWHDYVIETSAAFLGLSVLIAGLAFYFIFRIWHLVRNGPEMWRLRRKLGKMHDGHRHLTEGLIAVAGGNATEAGRFAVNARKLLGVTPATQLLQAQAAQLAGDHKAAREMFLVLAGEPGTAVLGYRGLIMEALRTGERGEAERLVEKLHRLRPETPWINLIRFELAARRQAWAEAGTALDRLTASQLMEPARIRQHQAALLLATAGDEVRQGHNDKALQAAERAMRLAPDWLPAVIVLARQQMAAGHKRAAHRTIERVWTRMPHPQLAAIYRAGNTGDPIKGYKDIERLCRDNEDEPSSRLALAEAALEADIWGEARRHLLALAGRNKATQAVYRLLARLERRESGNEIAALQWLTQAVDAPPILYGYAAFVAAVTANGRCFAAIAALSMRSTGKRRDKAAAMSMHRSVFSRRHGLVEPMSEAPRMLAVFDFDHTLIEGDSLWPFLVYVAGWPRAAWAAFGALFLLAAGFLKNKNDPALADRRSFIKAHLLHRLLTGRKTDDLRPAINKLYGWQKWNAPMREALLDHYGKGHQIVIASGGLDLYLPELLKDLPPRALICTRVEVRDGVITGLMLSGNCVRARKAAVLANYIEKNGPFAESWGYGNFPHDLPMLDLVKHRIIVS